MGKTRRGHKEFSKEQELKYENREFRKRERDKDNQINQLKREVNSLRRQLARLDLDRHSYVHEIVQEHLSQENADNEETTSQMSQRLKNTWLCHDCKIGHLEICLYTRMDETYYYRACSNCSKRTKAQKYDNTVQGIVKNTSPKPK